MSKTPRIPFKTLELLGLKQKDMEVYVALLRLGTAPLRRIAEEANLNRGTTYDSVKRLLDFGLVSYVDAKTHRYFTGEDPIKLRGLCTRREVAIQEAREKVLDAIPELQEILGRSEHRPAVRYYEGPSGVKDILKDVLLVTSKQDDKTYRVYSSSTIRGRIADCWTRWNANRKKYNVFCKAISVDEGGTVAGLDERRWLSHQEGGAPTYIFIYGGKTAHVAIDDNDELFGIIIEDAATAETQRMIFDKLWEVLE